MRHKTKICMKKAKRLKVKVKEVDSLKSQTQSQSQSVKVKASISISILYGEQDNRLRTEVADNRPQGRLRNHLPLH